MKKQVVLKNIHSFEPRHIFECGQCFRWKREADGSYTTVACGQVINVLKKDSFIIFNNVTEEEFYDCWYDYFDLGTDYTQIKQTLSACDDYLKSAVTYGSGIRILNQDLWECVVSFIISANNNIPRIQGIIERLCERFGDRIVFGGKDYYSFPGPERITGDLSFLRAGYREGYLKDACAAFLSGKIAEVKTLNTDEARKKLLQIKGVGPKVADCILLFGLGRREVFPVDVWVKRCLNSLYGEAIKTKSHREFAAETFGLLAGFAQQYLFYYMRDAGFDITGGIKNA